MIELGNGYIRSLLPATMMLRLKNEDGDVLDDGDFNEPSTELTLDMVQPS
jgi:hypothetical protein